MRRWSESGGRRGLPRSPWRAGATWLGLAVVATLLLAACGGDGDGDDVEAASQMFDASGKPIEKDETTEKRRSEDAAPDFEIALFENENHSKGEVFRLSEAQGSPVVVNFWFPSCPPCVAEMPDMDAAFKAHKSDGIEFVGVMLVGLDTVADGQAFVDDIGVTYALGPDETTSIIRDYKVTGFPATVFIDKDQNIVRKWTGFLNAEKIEELIQEILN